MNNKSTYPNSVSSPILERFLQAVYQPYKWLIVIPLFGIFTIVFSFFSIISSILISSKAGNFWAFLWGRIVCYIVPIRVFKKGTENIDKKKSYVIIANHQTAIDILMLSGFLGIDFRWIMKKELYKVPFLGFACKKAGYIFIDRKSAKASLESLNEAKQKLVNGTSVMIFPEGTRSGKKEMLQFKRGAFKMAVDLELDILPVTVMNSYKILRKGVINLMPGRAGFVIHSPLAIARYGNDMERLMKDARIILESGQETGIFRNSIKPKIN